MIEIETNYVHVDDSNHFFENVVGLIIYKMNFQGYLNTIPCLTAPHQTRFACGLGCCMVWVWIFGLFWCGTITNSSVGCGFSGFFAWNPHEEISWSVDIRVQVFTCEPSSSPFHAKRVWHARHGNHYGMECVSRPGIVKKPYLVVKRKNALMYFLTGSRVWVFNPIRSWYREMAEIGDKNCDLGWSLTWPICGF